MQTSFPISTATAIHNTCRGILLFSDTSISAVQVYQKVTYYHKSNSERWYAKTGTSNCVLPPVAEQISRSSIQSQKSHQFSKQLLWWFNMTCPASQCCMPTTTRFLCRVSSDRGFLKVWESLGCNWRLWQWYLSIIMQYIIYIMQFAFWVPKYRFHVGQPSQQLLLSQQSKFNDQKRGRLFKTELHLTWLFPPLLPLKKNKICILVLNASSLGCTKKK